jgi:FKBP-type peptidyl-prolyl cis-trans isomerase
MMKTVKLLFVSVALFGVGFASCSSGLSSSSSATDSVSYAVGVNLGTMVKQSPFEGLDAGLIAQGILDVLKDSSATLTDEQCAEILNAYIQNQRQKEETEQQEVAQKNLEAGLEFLANNKSAEGVVTLESGVQYKIVSAGTGPKPKATDIVKVHYKGTLLNGEVFDSSIERGEPVEFPLNQVIKGWTEGLQQVNAGSKVLLYIPSDLAYGQNGSGKIGPNSMLIFEVDLLEVKAGEDDAAAAPAPAKKAPAKK